MSLKNVMIIAVPMSFIETSREKIHKKFHPNYIETDVATLINLLKER